MICPRCNTPLSEIDFITHYGLSLKLDWCENCGGYWTDKLEAHSLKPGQIDNQDVVRETPALAVKSRPYHCPKDNETLNITTKHIVGLDCELDVCPKCGGIWFDPGELLRFKKFQTERIAKADELEKERILKAWEEEKYKSGFATFMEGLKRPVNLDTGYSVLGERSASDESISIGSVVVQIIFQTIFRLLLRG